MYLGPDHFQVSRRSMYKKIRISHIRLKVQDNIEDKSVDETPILREFHPEF